MSDAKLDFSFDARVAVQYDELRGHPPEVSRAIGAAVLREVGPMSRMLELGIGTGRIALPVAAAGCRVVGIDLSAEMLDALRRQLPGHAGEPIDLVRGDIAVLPFRAATFDAAMATHILHLVPDWKSVLGRLAEVLRPGGAILLGRDWVDPASMAGRIRMAFRQAVMAAGFHTAAPAGGKPLHEALLGVGASPVHAGPGELADEILEPVSAQLDEFAAREWAEPERPQVVLRRFLISVYRNGGAPPTPAVAPAAP